MRRSGILLTVLLLLGMAHGEENACLKAVGVLAEKTQDASTTWDERYEAYKEVKEALEGGDEKCQAAYEAIRADVADGLRRDGVPGSGWVMGLFGACLLWGGFSICCLIAIRSGKSGVEED
jgi:hypothetical protein